MIFIPFRLKILGAFLALLSSILIASLIIVERNQTGYIQASIHQQLTVTRSVFLSVLERRDQQLQTSLRLLGSDYAFKEAVATEEPATIESAAVNFKQRIGADAVWVADSSADVYADTSKWKKPGESLGDLPLIAQVLESEEPGAAMLMLNGVTFQLAAAPILAPDLIGVLMAGFRVDDEMAVALKKITRSDLSFLAEGKVLASTLDESSRAGLLVHHGNMSQDAVDIFGPRGKRQIVLRASLPKVEGVTAYVQRSWDDALEPLRTLRGVLQLIGFLGLGLTALAGFVIAGGVTASMEKLAMAAKKLEEGRFDVRVDIRQNDEIGQLGTAFNSMVEGLQEKEKMRSVLNKAVSKEIAEELMKRGELNLGGEERTITMLFSDIRGFTTISEGLEPKELVSQLNEYFTRMGGAIEKNNGVIDKYIGDAIMALFGAPIDSPKDAANAQRSALAMLEALAEYNAYRAANGLSPWNIGIGLHTGTAVAGNLGSVSRSSYTAIGDAVNLASRLESLTKHYGVEVIVSGSVRSASGEENPFLYRTLDLVRVKGKQEPVEVFELLGVGAEAPDWLWVFEDGMQAYRAKEFSRAKERFEEVLKISAGDRPAQIFLARIEPLLQVVPENWDPSFTMTEK